MSKKQSDPSQEAGEDPKIDSVYDFLYYDSKRVGSFLSQFDDFGHLSGLTHAESAERSSATQSSGAVSGGVPLVATGSAEHAQDTGKSYTKESQRSYDPLWVNALTFLDHVDAHRLLVRDISQANIGQFVLFSGVLAVADLQMMSKAWSLPSMQASIRQGAAETQTKGRQRKNARLKSGYVPNEIDLFLDFIKILPHTTQATLTSERQTVWCNLATEGLSIAASEIALKHGADVPGEWHAVGVLDAQPDWYSSPFAEDEPEIDFSDGKEVAAKLMKLLAPITRNMLGRSDRSYGITPLLIFRSVSN